MTPSTKLIDAAARLGVPVSEVTKVEDSPAGPIITTFDGVRYVDVPSSTPDAAGRSGLMLLVAPTKTYGGSLPVYAQPGAEDELASDDPIGGAVLAFEITRVVAQVLRELDLPSADQVLALGDRVAAIDEQLDTINSRLTHLGDRVTDVETAGDDAKPEPEAKPAAKSARKA
jgi:hypothetical protein